MKGKPITKSEMTAIHLALAAFRHPHVMGHDVILVQIICENDDDSVILRGKANVGLQETVDFTFLCKDADSVMPITSLIIHREGKAMGSLEGPGKLSRNENNSLFYKILVSGGKKS